MEWEAVVFRVVAVDLKPLKSKPYLQTTINMTDQLLNERLDHFSPITLEEMGKVRLMNRTDTKYITSMECLYQLLSQMDCDYYIQEIDKQRMNSYETVYLDTSDAEMFIAHHNGHSKREKVRIRTYVNSNIRFLEIKKKNNKGRTSKKRIQLTKEEDYVKVATDFLNPNCSFEASMLFPHVETDYDRITLVNSAKSERLTIDVNLSFKNHRTGEYKALPDFVILELKQDANKDSFARQLFTDFRLRPTGLSKYCIGSILTDPTLKRNLFKNKLVQINKLSNYKYGVIS